MFSKRIESMGTSIFSTMSKFAIDNNAVNLGQGFPDFDGPQWIMDSAYEAMKAGKNQYAPSNGILSLRKSISELYKKYYNLDWDPNDEIVITHGATEALYSTINAILNPGDEVIVFEPVYDSYIGDVQMAGGILKYVTLYKPDFNFDFKELKDSISEKTKLIIINNPHNPTGKVWTIDELNIIAKIAIKHNLYVISDEVYEFITFDEFRHIPIAALPGMKNRTITISSTGKTFSLTGWKIGWAIASKEITDAIKKVHQWVTFAINTPAQHAMANALSNLEEYLPQFRKMYTNKRDLIYNLLLETKFIPHKPKGSYFIMIELPEGYYGTDVEIAIELVKNYQVATIPPSVFYGKSDEGKSMLRLCFAKNDNTIINGINHLNKFKF